MKLIQINQGKTQPNDSFVRQQHEIAEICDFQLNSCFCLFFLSILLEHMSQTHRNPSKAGDKLASETTLEVWPLGLPTGRRSRDRGRERSERLAKQFLLWTGAGCVVALSMCILWRRSYNYKNLQSDC